MSGAMEYRCDPPIYMGSEKVGTPYRSIVLSLTNHLQAIYMCLMEPLLSIYKPPTSNPSVQVNTPDAEYTVKVANEVAVRAIVTAMREATR